MKPFLRNFGFFALMALLFAAASERVPAGEPVIFRDANSKSRIPREKLDLNVLRPHTPGFNKGSSSVEGVLAPWEGPIQPKHRFSPQQRRRLLDALDRKKNWGMQDLDAPADLNASPFDIELEKIENGGELRRFGHPQDTIFEQYYAEHNSAERRDSKDLRFRRDYSSIQDALTDEESAGEKEENFFGALATAKDFEMQIDSIFNQPGWMEDRRAERLSESAGNFLKSVVAQELSEESDDAFGTFEARADTVTQTTLQAFEPLSNTLAPTAGAANQQPTGLAVWEHPGVAAQPNISRFRVSELQSGMTEGTLPAINPAIPPRSAIEPIGTAIGQSAIGRFGVSGNPSAAPSVRNQPAIFKLPKRSF